VDYLVDTSVLVRALLPSDPKSGVARRALSSLLANGRTLVLLPQIVAELWTVATRPEAENGLGYSPERLCRLIDRYKEHFEFRYETEAVFKEWRELVSQLRVRGKQVHDARIAAAAIAHGIDGILTFNPRDFQRYEGIAIVDPGKFAAD
jgi:predicted nucleic acid-binding protein